MNTYAKVQSLITAWKSQSLSRTDLIRAIAEACLGWPYVWGAAGQKCTPSHRRAYAARYAVININKGFLMFISLLAISH